MSGELGRAFFPKLQPLSFTWTVNVVISKPLEASSYVELGFPKLETQ